MCDVSPKFHKIFLFLFIFICKKIISYNSVTVNFKLNVFFFFFQFFSEINNSPRDQHHMHTVIQSITTYCTQVVYLEKKTTLRMGENTCKQINGQRINLQNIQTAHAAQYQKSKQPNPKMGRRPK